MGFECPVCLETYDLKTREPKVLRCNHTVCSECVTRLIRGDSLVCPTCRRTTEQQDISINFGLRDGIAERCDGCLQEKRSQTCRHCDRDICTACMMAHAALYRSALKTKIDTLRATLVMATAQSMDQTAIEHEATKAKCTVEHIQDTVASRKHDTDKLGMELEKHVKDLSDFNTTKHEDWTKDLDVKLDECKMFIRTVQDKMTLKNIEELTVDHMAVYHREVDENLRDLSMLQDNTPIMDNYTFVPSSCVLKEIGKISTDGQTVSNNDMKNVAITGKQGSGADDFGYDVMVAFMGDRIFVSDAYNHRLKFYDKELHLKSITGTRGSGRNDLDHPWGVCAIGDELFVCDKSNHRVKTYDKYFRIVHVFGKKGSGVGEFDTPLGITGGPDSLVYICDSENYRVQVVRKNGTHVRSIGSRGIGSGKFPAPPHAVGVTSSGTVLVIDSSCSNVHMFSQDGQFLAFLVNAFLLKTSLFCLYDIAVDKNDNIILSEINYNRLIVLNVTGQIVREIRSGYAQEAFHKPSDVAVNQTGDIVVYEMDKHRLQVFNMDMKK